MKSLTKIFFLRLHQVFGDPKIKFSFIIIISIIVISTILLFVNISGTTYKYIIGDIAAEDIRVPNDIYFKKEFETKIARQKAAENVAFVFDRDASILLDKLKRVGILFNNVITTLEENPPLGTEDLTFQLMALKSPNRLPKHLHYNDQILLELLRYKNPSKLKKVTYKILIYIYDNHEMGILDKPFEYSSEVDTRNILKIRTINSTDSDEEVLRKLDSLKTIDEIRQRIYSICYSIAPNLPQSTLRAIVQIVRFNLTPNISFNSEETKRRIDEGTKQVKSVMGLLKKGQTLVREGDTITTDILHKIGIFNKHAKSSNFYFIIGVFLLQLIFLAIFGFFLLEYNQILIPDKITSVVIFSVLSIFMIYTFSIARFENIMSSKLAFALLLPIPFVTMIISILNNMYLAILVGVHVVFFTILISGGDVSTTIVAFSSAILGVFVNTRVERRTDFLRGGFKIGLINSVVIIAISLMEENLLKDTITNIQLSFANGIINSILVLGLFPLYESLFGITTKFKLLELSDLNAEIFKKMLVEAPGTYNHSLIVSTMAETACVDINARHLLARVGAYYHDIGKIINAGIYIENKVTDPKAKSLSHKQYSQLIISHVKEGVDLAKKHGLPESIIEFIREHHGKSIMSFFYHQALEEANKSGNPDVIDKSDFQYPGPKPHSKETAIVMLADSIEAASRSLQEPTYLQLEGLVKKIIYNKLNEGDLDYSDLSMSDLNRIQKSFLKILNGIFHTRIEYPEKDEVMDLEAKVKPNGKNSNRNNNGITN